MTVDDRILMQNYDTVLIKKQQKHQHYHLKKIDKCEYLTRAEILPFNWSQIIEQVKFTYSFLEKVLKKKKKKQVDALKLLNLSKANELKQIEKIFPQNSMNDLPCDRLKRALNYEAIFFHCIDFIAYYIFKRYIQKSFINTKCW